MQSQTRVAESVAWFPFDESARDRPAILAPGRPELTYSELERHVTALAGSLATAGLKRTARVATMLRAGAESAAAFLGVAAAAVCAPLTPALGRADLTALRRLLAPRSHLPAPRATVGRPSRGGRSRATAPRARPYER